MCQPSERIWEEGRERGRERGRGKGGKGEGVKGGEERMVDILLSIK